MFGCDDYINQFKSGGIHDFSGKRPDNLGIKNGQLAAVPKSPNCVSSQNGSKKHGIKAFQLYDDPTSEMLRLKDILGNLKGVTIISYTKDYIYAECKSPLMRFDDDLEFYHAPNSNVFHVRSASRLGYSDLGMNRSRVEKIRALFEK